MQPVTIGITARNAAATIERAVRSALSQGDYPILLIDDWSGDGTASIAKALGCERVSVVMPSEHRTLGYARQTGIFEATTPYLVWLDSDDEFLPGRVERMLRCFLRSADIVSDGVELVDGTNNTLKHVASIPSFLAGENPLVRQFERNYLPGSAMIGLRVSLARQVGYDGALSAAEDSDFLLRSALRNPRVCLLPEVGYRMYTYANSLSRNIANQRAMVCRTLMKHDYRDVLSLYLRSGYNSRIAHWALVSMAIFREEYEKALEFLAVAETMIEDPAEVLEPGGPVPHPEGWRLAFQRGTLLLLLNRCGQAMAELEWAEKFRPSAEGANNLGVAYAQSGKTREARLAFSRAVQIFPRYLDGRMNLTGAEPLRITTHPLRAHPARDDYAADVSRGQTGDCHPGLHSDRTLKT
jgi:glycosyltransferase involved in cell wall biosynthesis